MSFLPDLFVISSRIAYCLTCSGTGVRGGNLGGGRKPKKCKSCNGRGRRELHSEPTTNTTVDLFQTYPNSNTEE